MTTPNGRAPKAFAVANTTAGQTLAAVLPFTVFAATVTGLSGAAAHWPPWAVLTGTLAAAALAANTTAGTLPTPERPASDAATGFAGRIGAAASGRLARVGLAVGTGLFAAQLASCVLFGPAIGHRLADQAHHDASRTPAALAARTALDQARADRAAQDRSVRNTQHDLDEALLVARCETEPGPECPRTHITGIPGRGPAALVAESALAATGDRLTSEQHRTALLDDRIDQWQQILDRDRSQTAPDSSVLAAWRALNQYTAAHPAALLLRVMAELGTVALAVLPVLVAQRRRPYDLPPVAEAGALLGPRLRIEPVSPALADPAHEPSPQRRRVLALGNVEIGVIGPAPAPAGQPTPATNGTMDLHAVLARLPLGGVVTRVDALLHDTVQVIDTLRHTRRVTVDLATEASHR